MCDVPGVLCDPLSATVMHDDAPLDAARPTTPLPNRPRMLRRTISYASIDTVCPPKNKGIRRSIQEIAENLKYKSTKKKTNHSSAQDIPKNASREDSNASSKSKAARRGRKATSPLRDSSHRSEEASVLAIANRLHSDVPLELGLDPPLTFPGCKSESLTDVPLFKEYDGDEIWEDCSLPTRTLALGAHLTMEHDDTTLSPPADIKNIQLVIQPSETDVTVWDGLQAAHHVFKCRLFLRCTTHLYDSVSLPDIRLVEMHCNTRPTGSHYARLPVLQSLYEGATPGWVTNSGVQPSVNLAAGIHMDRAWGKMQNDDGTWGWYRDAYVPLSSRLFDKMEYREFNLVSRVWVGESCMEDELTFGISMLLRGVDMK